MECIKYDIESLVLAVLLHPLKDLVIRAWGDKPPCWIEDVYQKIKKDYKLEKFEKLTEKSVQLALGREKPPPKKGDEQHLPLISIFSGLTLKNEESENPPKQVGYFSPSILTEKPVYPEIVPIEEITSNYLDAEEYKELFQELFKELKGEIEAENCLHVNNTTVLMQKYCSFIPYETVPVSESDLMLPDVSVYDVCKIASAIASCIYIQSGASYQQENNIDSGTESYLFVAGDFSGVQNFIYTINSRGALKTLRARSFFLELLTIHITQRIVREIGVTPLNILYSGGGRFAILVPATEQVKAILPKIKQDFNRYLAEEHGAQLYLVMEWAEKNEKELKDEDFLGKTEDLHEKLVSLFRKIEAAKKRRFGYIMESSSSDFINLIKPFYPKVEGKNRQVLGIWDEECPLCHKGKKQIRVEIKTETRLGSSLSYKVDGCEKCLSEEKWEEWLDGKHRGECRVCRAETPFLFGLPEAQREGEEVPVCWLCHNLYHMGEHLPMEERRYLLRVDDYMPSRAVVKVEDWYYYLVEREKANSLLEDGKAKEAWVINSIEPKDYYLPNFLPVFVGRHQLYQKKNGRKMPLDFHDLADWAVGASRLGVLRMDVDDMGDIFNYGLRKGSIVLNPESDKQSSSYFARWATLSRQLDLFFKFYMNKICKGVVKEEVFTLSCFEPDDVSGEISKGRKAVIVYSGGDDLFIIGAWSDVVELAFDIHNSFKYFIAENPEIGLSAGFICVDEHFPIHLMAELSKKALDRAKKNIEKVKISEDEEIEIEKAAVSLFWSDKIKREIEDEEKEKIIEPVFRWEEWIGEGQTDWASAEEVVKLVELFLSFREADEITLETSRNERRIKIRLSRAFIHSLFNLIEIYKQKGKFYLARMAYTLSQREPETGGLDNEKKIEAADNWQKLTDNLIQPFSIRYLLPAITWVELLQRAKSPERKEG